MDIQENTEITESVRAVLAEALQVPLSEVTPDLAFGDLPQWDSLGHMEVMMRLEEHFGVEISADSIAQLVSIPVIVTRISANGGEERGDA